MKRLSIILIILVFCVLLTACASEPVPMPEDFGFSLAWNTYGISSYDSRTGELIKTTDATHPEDYITTRPLTAEERSRAWELLSALDWDKYPDAPEQYAPTRGVSYPYVSLRLYIHQNGEEKLIFADTVSFSYDAKNKAAEAFLDTCDALSDMIMDSEAWRALPEYEFLYD